MLYNSQNDVKVNANMLNFTVIIQTETHETMKKIKTLIEGPSFSDTVQLVLKDKYVFSGMLPMKEIHDRYDISVFLVSCRY